MKYMISEHGAGKTTYLALWAKGKSNRVIVTPTYKMAKQIIDVHNVPESQVVSIANLNKLKGKDIVLGIDELTSVLQTLLYYDVEIVTDTQF